MIYIFDFDGVLFKTVKEIGIITYLTIKGKDIDPDTIPQKYHEFFAINRVHPVDGAGMLLTSKLCIEELEKGKEPYLIDKNIFLKEYEKSADIKRDYEKEFFEIRNNYATKNTAKWVSFNSPYPLIWNLLKDKDFYIVSNKNRSSIKLLIKNFGKDLDDKYIYSSDEKGNKAQKILKIHELEKQDCIFVDDALDNLVLIKNELKDNMSFLRLYLAGWGHVSKEDFELAKTIKDITILNNEEDFLKIYK